MAKKLYSIKQHPETREWHIFVSSHGLTSNECILNEKSICEKMDNTSSAIKNELCMGEEETRKRVEEIGKMACGICASSLYKTPQK